MQSITKHLARSWRRCVALMLGGMICVAYGAAETAPTPIRCELAVVGGGSGGFGAALAAARLGVDTLLVEKADCLGGNSVRSGVNCWEPGAGGTGIPFELYLRLKRIPHAVGIYSFGRHMSWYRPDKEPYRFPGGETVIDPARVYLDTLRRYAPEDGKSDEAFRRAFLHGVVFEPEAMAQTMLAMLQETRHCRVLLNTAFIKVQSAQGRLQSITLSTGQTVEAKYFIDATGDGLLCQGAGCKAMMGQESADTFHEPAAPAQAANRINGVSLLYRITPTTNSAIEPLPKDIPAQCAWAGKFPAAQITQYPNGDWNINMLPTMEGAEFLRLGYAEAMAECRRRVRAHWHYLQSGFAEFQNYRLKYLAPALGIRESRRIAGDYVLTQNDLLAGLSAQKHPDIICVADHSMDTHGSHTRASGELRQPYGVPYRCLIPQGYRNLLIACRAASFSSIAASSCRLSRTMMQLGQAAGTAVALAHESKLDLPEVPAEKLRASLRQQHVQLEHPMPAELKAHLAQESPALDRR